MLFLPIRESFLSQEFLVTWYSSRPLSWLLVLSLGPSQPYFYWLNHDVLVMFVIQIYRRYQIVGPAVDMRLTRQRGGSRVDRSLQSVVTY